MSTESMDLEDCNNFFKGFVGSMFVDDLDVNSFLNPPFKKSQPYTYISSNSLYDMPSDVLNIRSDLTGLMERAAEEYLEPLVDYIDNKKYFNDDLPTFGNSSLSDMEPELLLVSPDSVLPGPLQKEDIASLESVWPDFDLNPKLMKYDIDDDYVSLDEILIRGRPRKLTHLDIDHCYSQRPYDDEDYYFNSSPYSPASSSCSDRLVANRGVKRSRPKKKVVRRKRIKKEVTESSEDEEVDVETPCTIPLVPKITIAITPPPTPPAPAKRGRKPKDKSKGQIVDKHSNKNCPVSPKVLQAAIKQQKKKSYVTKSGRVTKISNSVETTPSTSTPSSVNNSRCNSDNEDSVDKRASHNMAERNRRQELTNLFQQLRQKVPEIKKNPKASKVSILQSSTSYVADLEEIEKQKMLLKEQLKAEIENKLALVQSLKSSRACSS